MRYITAKRKDPKTILSTHKNYFTLYTYIEMVEKIKLLEKHIHVQDLRILDLITSNFLWTIQNYNQ